MLSPVGLRVKPEKAVKVARDDWFDETPEALKTLKDGLWGKVTPFKMYSMFLRLRSEESVREMLDSRIPKLKQ